MIPSIIAQLVEHSAEQPAQRTSEWFARRANELLAPGSEAATRMGVNPFMTRERAIRIKRDPQAKAEFDLEMRHRDSVQDGIKFEDEAIRRYEAVRPEWTVLRMNMWVDPDNPNFVCSPDGLAVHKTDPTQLPRLIEVKCRAAIGGVGHYIHQIQHSLLVLKRRTGLECECDFVQFVPKTGEFKIQAYTFDPAWWTRARGFYLTFDDDTRRWHPPPTIAPERVLDLRTDLQSTRLVDMSADDIANNIDDGITTHEAHDESPDDIHVPGDTAKPTAPLDPTDLDF